MTSGEMADEHFLKAGGGYPLWFLMELHEIQGFAGGVRDVITLREGHRTPL